MLDLKYYSRVQLLLGNLMKSDRMLGKKGFAFFKKVCKRKKNLAYLFYSSYLSLKLKD